MYAFNEPLKRAWGTLLSPIEKIIREIDGGTEALRVRICFDTHAETYLAPNLLLGHTCGYPYVTRWNKSHQLICVPEFDIPGCEGTLYSSWFVCGSADKRDTIEAFRDGVAVINGPNSNSGMNVFRYQVSPFAKNGSFFNDVIVSGSHINSMRAVAEGRAEIAAIDAVSYHYIVQAEPTLARQTRIMGQSVKTTGLPFIAHADEPIPSDVLTHALNRCLDESPTNESELLGLTRFTGVDDANYDCVFKLETDAIVRGYPSLQ